MDENMIKIISFALTILGIVVAVVVAFYKMKSEFREELYKVEKSLTDEIVKQNQKSHQLEIELVTLKGRDENQQQIINQFQSQVLDHLPKIYEIIGNQGNNKKTK